MDRLPHLIEGIHRGSRGQVRALYLPWPQEGP
jgi:hypothetical protein